MCRSIKTLRTEDGPPQSEEIEAAALQFIRKISGFRKPSAVNREVFDKAVEDVAAASRDLLENLIVRGSSKQGPPHSHPHSHERPSRQSTGVPIAAVSE
jgi:hypothetical protein